MNNQFLNIGGGTHPMHRWDVLDKTGTEYNFDPAKITFDVNLREMKPWPIPDGTYEIVYSGHTLEHVTEAAWMFAIGEVMRIMQPGGVFRMQVPDYELFWADAEKADLNTDRGCKALVDLVTSFASSYKDAGKANPQIIKNDMEKLGPEGFASKYTKLAMLESYKSYRGHLSYFTWLKLSQVISDVGFVDVRRAAQHDSIRPEMKDDPFDCTIPDHSLYVEAIKP